MNHLYYGDNLEWLRDKSHFPDEFVDLIYLDPPSSFAQQGIPVGSDCDGA